MHLDRQTLVFKKSLKGNHHHLIDAPGTALTVQHKIGIILII